ncbi:MAG TPA: creatininase family protein, partial [Longimicrobiales bacterium]|nr:creatininase family protein [Longimicrobiales bacterium]
MAQTARDPHHSAAQHPSVAGRTMSRSLNSLSLQDLSWVDVAATLARDPRLLVPVGALEQHGPHLPLGSNVRIAERMCNDLSRQYNVLRAPTFHFGVSRNTARSFAGTAGLHRKTLHRALNELLASWEDHGVNEFILITGHRHRPHLEALATLVTDHARVRVVDFWDVDIRDLVPDAPAEHAGEAETSLMLHLFPDLVRMDRARNFAPRTPRGTSATRNGTGSVGNPTRADPET